MCYLLHVVLYSYPLPIGIQTVSCYLHPSPDPFPYQRLEGDTAYWNQARQQNNPKSLIASNTISRSIN